VIFDRDEIMLHFEGDKVFPQSPDQLSAKLSDARFLIQCVPGVEAVRQAEPSIGVCTLRPGFSFVRGTLEITIQLTGAEVGKSVEFSVVSKGIGSTSKVEAAVALAPAEQGTQVHWQADVKELGGLLKAIPQGLIKASAQKVIADVWASIESRLAS
jgi:carbon monoxide dehydrogenase subunit G